jgi:hypothetical protein
MASAATSDRWRSRERSARRHQSESAVLANDAVQPEIATPKATFPLMVRGVERSAEMTKLSTVYRLTASE